jgi:hypothetical protein
MKHTLKEILAHFAVGAQHTHEQACQSTYDLGFAAGAESVKVQVLAGDKDLRREIDERHEAEVGESDAKQEDAPAGTKSQKGKDAGATTAKDAAA